MLQPDGRALFADIPNVDTKQRFLSSEPGKEFLKQWNDQKKNNEENVKQLDEVPLEKDPHCIVFNDEIITRMLNDLKEEGYDACLLPQDPKLPFSHTREDLLVKKK